MEKEYTFNETLIGLIALFMLFVLVLNILGYFSFRKHIDEKLRILEAGQTQISWFLMTPNELSKKEKKDGS